jgi:hypothetical protein
MDNDGIDYFFGTPPLFVRLITRANVEKAFIALLQEPKWLEVYGR